MTNRPSRQIIACASGQSTRVAPWARHMSLAMVDRGWPSGRIGEWVRRYRPDLLP